LASSVYLFIHPFVYFLALCFKYTPLNPACLISNLYSSS
jgi:hypothetical protein